MWKEEMAFASSVGYRRLPETTGCHRRLHVETRLSKQRLPGATGGYKWKRD